VADIELLACMGDDLMVADAARVSFSKKSDWEVDELGHKNLPKRDAAIINFLAKHNHWSPFSHPQLQFRVRMPIFIANQWFKHVVGFSRNSVSRRYVNFEPTIFKPKYWRQGAPSIKQGSLLTEVKNPDLCDASYKKACDVAMESYNSLMANGVAPEQARMVLPMSMYTEFVETGSLFGYARLCNLRMQPDAQKEIQDYAAMIDEAVSKKFPVSWKALTSEILSKKEVTNETEKAVQV
jgi:thymidylate synthase (FAD)